MLNKIKKLKEGGLTLRQIEKKAGIGNGVLRHILKTGKWSQRTERRLDEFLVRRACTYLEISIGEQNE